MKKLSVFSLTCVLYLVSTLSLAHGDNQDHEDVSLFSGLETDAAAVVKAFHHAQENGDKAAVIKHLSDDVIIFEGGGVERSAQQYASHHMNADMKFLAAMTITTLEHHVKVNGNVAVSLSRSHLKGKYRGKDYDREGMETITLTNQNGQWRITHIHWSN